MASKRYSEADTQTSRTERRKTENDTLDGHGAPTSRRPEYFHRSSETWSQSTDRS
jgi:hypothetical protein